MALPAILHRGARGETPFLLSALVAAAAREVLLTRLYLAGGLGAAGLCRGGLLFCEGLLLNDVLAVWFPAYNYVLTGPPAYAGRAAWAVAAATTVWWLTRARSRGDGWRDLTEEGPVKATRR
jgi:hypothetical protein